MFIVVERSGLAGIGIHPRLHLGSPAAAGQIPATVMPQTLLATYPRITLSLVRKVVATRAKYASHRLVEIGTVTGERIRTTSDHHFSVSGVGWSRTGELTPRQHLTRGDDFPTLPSMPQDGGSVIKNGAQADPARTERDDLRTRVRRSESARGKSSASANAAGTIQGILGIPAPAALAIRAPRADSRARQGHASLVGPETGHAQTGRPLYASGPADTLRTLWQANGNQAHPCAVADEEGPPANVLLRDLQYTDAADRAGLRNLRQADPAKTRPAIWSGQDAEARPPNLLQGMLPGVVVPVP